MPGSTLITGSLLFLFKLCPYFQSVQFKLFAALDVGMDSQIQFGQKLHKYAFHKLHKYAFLSFVAPLPLMKYIYLAKGTYCILKGVQLYIIKISCIFQIGRPALEFSLDLGPHCCPC